MTATPIQAIRIAPVSESERIAFLDVLRGFALWGVLASNMIGFSSPDIHFAPSLLWTDSVNRAVNFLLDVLVSEKFLTIFAVLFGIGFAIQMERASLRGQAAFTSYKLRLLGLFLLGLINGIYFWAGDILVTYAAFGMLLLLFHKREQKTVMWWTVGLYCIMLVLSLLTGKHGAGSVTDQLAAMQQEINLYGHGTWEAIQAARFRDFLERHVGSITLLLPFIFPRFLFGLWLWRSGFIKNTSSHKAILRHLCFWGIIIGVTGEIITSVFTMGDMGPLRVICIPLLAAGYASGIVLLVLSGKFSGLFRALASVGRTSLSNYLFQNVICTTLCYSYGFGLYGKLNPLSGLAISILIFIVEILISVWIMKKFQFGPMEWLLRSFTYRHWQAMKKVCAATE